MKGVSVQEKLLPIEPANRNLLILDLDETLIHATSRRLDAAPDFAAGPYFVYKRPGLDAFIEAVAQHYELALWSSATADYIAEITRGIIPNNVTLQFIWSHTRCIARYDPQSYNRYWLKDLKKVKRAGYDLKKILIVDDEPIKLQRNYGNAVYVTSFEGNLNDTELDLLAVYLLSLASVDNVRTIEKRNWRSAARLLVGES